MPRASSTLAGGRKRFRQMEALGLRPVSLSEKAPPKSSAKPSSKPAGKPAEEKAAPGPKPSFNISLGGAPKVSTRELENFTRLLSSLLSAGIPLSRAMVILCREASSPVAQAQWKQIHALVIDGMSLATAMGRFPETFPRVYVAMVEAGETGGFLDIVLAQIADFQAREKEMRSKVTTALMYPIILLVLALAVLIFLLVFFIPKFQTIFTGFGAKLPLLTQIIVSTSEFLRSYGVFILILIVVAVVALKNWFSSEKGRRAWEGAILKSPVVGPLLSQFAMSRFCRMLGTLLGAGVPLINGLNVARKSMGNQVLVDTISDSIELVKKGRALGPSLSDSKGLFSGATLEMISVAEETGRLDNELVRIAQRHRGRLGPAVKIRRRDGRAAPAVSDRGIHRNHLYWHGDPHLLPARPH